MFSKAAILGLASTALVAAAPNPWGQPESTCSAVTTWTTYEYETTVPYYETSTYYVTSATAIEGFVTKTSTYYPVETYVTETPSCIETSYPITVWVTKEITTQVPVTEYETCTETSVYSESTCSTAYTTIAEFDVCTAYQTECLTTSACVTTTECEPCESTPTPTYWKQ
jgi:hypothetical protein